MDGRRFVLEDRMGERGFEGWDGVSEYEMECVENGQVWGWLR